MGAAGGDSVVVVDTTVTARGRGVQNARPVAPPPPLWIRQGPMLLLLVVAVIAAVALAGLTTWRSKLSRPETPFPALEASTDPAVIAKGRYLVHGPAHCDHCHSTAGELAADTIWGGRPFSMGPLGTTWAANLSADPAHGLGGRSDAEIARTLRAAVLPSGDISVRKRIGAPRLSDADLVAVLSYLRTLPAGGGPVPQARWTLLGKVAVRLFFPPMEPLGPAGPEGPATEGGPSHARGRYLAESVMRCVPCHSELDTNTLEPIGARGGGGTPEPHSADREREFAAPNLTSHTTGVTGRLDEAAFVQRLRGGSPHPDSPMPWGSFARAADDDLRSVYRYLRSLPAVNRDTGPTLRERGWRPAEP